MPKIAIRQAKNGNMDPTLQICLTEHPKYLQGAMTTESIDHAINVIRKWMEGKLHAGQNSTVEQNKNSV